MLIIALVLAVVGLAALVAAVVTSNELIAWVCIAASVIGVVLLIVDALRERSRRDGGGRSDDEQETAEFDAEYPDETEPADDASTDVHADRDSDLEEDTTAVPIDQRDDEVAHEDRR